MPAFAMRAARSHQSLQARVTLIRTSDRTGTAISEWPDERTRDDAMRLIEKVRGRIHADDGFRMTGEMKGAVVAEV